MTAEAAIEELVRLRGGRGASVHSGCFWPATRPGSAWHRESVNRDVEVLSFEHGYWCQECSLRSGVRAWLVVQEGTSTAIGNVSLCRECGGEVVSSADAG